MRRDAPTPARIAIGAAVGITLGGCGPRAEVDDITPGGPSSLSPALDPTYEGRDLRGSDIEDRVSNGMCLVPEKRELL